MKERIAIATISGKAYYFLVSELRRRNAPFLSLTPRGPIPAEVRVVISTEQEKGLIDHDKVLAYNVGDDPASIVSEALRIVHGKELFEKVTIGVDPGEVFGIAVLAGGKVVETENCYSMSGTVRKIEQVIKELADEPVSSITVKVGDGVPACKAKLLRALDKTLPSTVVLESVKEAGTNSCLDKAKHRRGLRDIFSATRIAGRNGHAFQRSRFDESYS